MLYTSSKVYFKSILNRNIVACRMSMGDWRSVALHISRKCLRLEAHALRLWRSFKVL